MLVIEQSIRILLTPLAIAMAPRLEMTSGLYSPHTASLAKVHSIEFPLSVIPDSNLHYLRPKLIDFKSDEFVGKLVPDILSFFVALS